MEFKHNATFRIVDGQASGLYRVVVASPARNVVAAVLLRVEGVVEKNPTAAARPRKSAGGSALLQWFRLDDLEAQVASGSLLAATIAASASFYRAPLPRHKKLFDQR